MDEKGFLMGRLTKSKRIFSQDLRGSGKLIGVSQDGSREWITIVAAICADGTTLPPLLIYQSDSGTIRDSWLQDFDFEQHNCWFSSSPNGWTSDELGLKWLESLFQKESRESARRDWRMLFVDGYGSHVTTSFLKAAMDLKILVVIYPPHSTHRLQPLDVGCFALLATYYSQNLKAFTSSSEGLTRMSKQQFFKVFWPAWQKAFTEKNVAFSWSKTGLVPWNPEVVLNQLKPTQEDLSASRRHGRQPSSSPSVDFDSPTARRKIRAIVNQVIEQKTKKLLSKISNELISEKAKNKILMIENKKAIGALRHAKKQKTRGKKLMEEFRSREQTTAIIFSPSKVKKCLELEASRGQAKEQLKLDKALKAAQRESAKERKAQEVQQKRDDRVAALAAKKEAAAVEKATKAAARTAKRAQKQLEKDSKVEKKVSKGRIAKKRVVKKPAAIVRHPLAQIAPNQQSSRSGRIIKTPRHHSDI
jgi:hypothetical protein